MKQCKNCRSNVDDNFRFCPNCGGTEFSELEECVQEKEDVNISMEKESEEESDFFLEEEQKSELMDEKQLQKKKIFLIGGSIVFVIAVLIAIVLLVSGKNHEEKEVKTTKKKDVMTETTEATTEVVTETTTTTKATIATTKSETPLDLISKTIVDDLKTGLSEYEKDLFKETGSGISIVNYDVLEMNQNNSETTLLLNICLSNGICRRYAKFNVRYYFFDKWTFDSLEYAGAMSNTMPEAKITEQKLGELISNKYKAYTITSNSYNEESFSGEASIYVNYSTEFLTKSGTVRVTYSWSSDGQGWIMEETVEEADYAEVWDFSGNYTCVTWEIGGFGTDYTLNFQKISDTEYKVDYYAKRIDYLLNRYTGEKSGSEVVIINPKEKHSFYLYRNTFAFDEEGFWIEAYPPEDHQTEKKCYLQRNVG